MAGLKVPCPKCQSVLKLKDRSLLGKTGKCPKCGHRFVLTEPQPKPEQPKPIQIELVEDQPASEPAPQQPAAGKNPTWLPDASPTPQPTQEEVNPLGSLFSEQPPAAAGSDNPLGFLQEESPPALTTPVLDFGNDAPADSSPVIAATSAPDSEPVTTSSRRKKRRRRSSGGWITMVVMLLVVGGGAYFIYQQMQPGQSGLVQVVTTPETPATPTTPTANVPPTRANVPPPVAQEKKSSGRPIQLLHLPAGVRIAINLRPAKLWSQQPRLAEFRASLGPLGTWLETQLKEFTKQPPEEIEEVLVGIILGPRGTPPEYAAVIHLKEAKPKADLLTTYSGTPYEEFNTNIQVIDGRAYQIIDDKTISFCPEKYVDDMLTFAKSPAITANQIEEILTATDRDKLFTVAFDPMDLDQHLETLFPQTAQMAIEKAIRWLGDDAAAATWSLNVGEDFQTDLAILGQTTSKPTMLKTKYQDRLNAVPELLLTSIQKMEPQRSGYRKIIGRFPAMLKVLSMTTGFGVDGQFVKLATLLPAKAGPNLALGTLLAWDESTRTDFNAVAVRVPVVEEKPKTFAEKLATKMDVDFRRTPLQEAIAYIAEESKIYTEIDGDALKLAGFTKNMPQTHKAEDLNTIEALYTIIQKYEAESDPLVVIVSEKDQRIIIMTASVAKKQGLEPYDFSKLKKP